MAKFILSVGDNTFNIIASEAKKRDVTVQQLLRAVIVPEWVRQKVEANPPSMALREAAILPGQRDQVLQTTVSRFRR